MNIIKFEAHFQNSIINILYEIVINPIMVGNFAFPFNCTPVGQTSDSMTVWT